MEHVLCGLGTAAEMTMFANLLSAMGPRVNKHHAYLGNTNEPLSNEGGEADYFYNEAGKYPKEKIIFLFFSSQ